mmetsp:Transcript_46118/g.55529  ORF Transcript_46118/g.55529 Transcript_46118/m.55529 type:complete len:352 (-) Transcript_46118:37-1092(-)
MVFKMEDAKDVWDKRHQETEVAHTSVEKFQRSKSNGLSKRRPKQGSANMIDSDKTRSRMAKRERILTNLQLSSLPGIATFTDRAVIGMLKTFAGIHRDETLRKRWRDDIRLTYGVGSFHVEMIFGMNAGWAVEGAVGSDYKIDATYLSPHVNMASRMMSATRQYKVTILFSQAIEELMSDQARAKLRHIDTVTVKGSSVQQRIFTYDARHEGVDFFLFNRPDEQADMDSEMYSANIWNTDQDLRQMRQHISAEFEDEFILGRNAYLAGNWDAAFRHLEKADEIMVETIIESGYLGSSGNGDESDVEDDSQSELGDGPSKALMAYIKREGLRDRGRLVAPKAWGGYRPLTSK